MGGHTDTVTPITPRDTYIGTFSEDPRSTNLPAKVFLPRQHLMKTQTKCLQTDKQTQTLPCRLSQTADHPTQGELHQPQTCMHVKVSSAQTPYIALLCPMLRPGQSPA